MLDLATLVAPMSVDAFLDDLWPDRPWWCAEGPERVAALADIEALASAEAALAGAGRVLVFRPDGGAAQVATGAEAVPLHKLGLTCSFGGLHVPELREAAARLGGDLGLPAGSMTCEVFCSSGRSGAGMHSDHDVNFAVLLRGHKRWRLAPNQHIRNQTNMCVPAGVTPPDPSQLLLADRTPFPEAMPSDALELEFGPGGVLFMPRGWWHETASDGDCLQVNFVATGPTWITVLLRGVEQQLLRDPQWRAYAFDAAGPDRRARLASLLAGLIGTLSAIEPVQLAARYLSDAGFDSFL